MEQPGEQIEGGRDGGAMADAPAVGSGRDRREHRRFPVEGWAEILVADGTMFFRGEIVDISAAGCYIATRAQLDFAPGALVEMIFRVRGTEFRPMAATRIIRPGNGAGFSFVTLNSKLKMQLDALIEVLSAAADKS